jgi:hypothetical protein
MNESPNRGFEPFRFLDVASKNKHLKRFFVELRGYPLRSDYLCVWARCAPRGGFDGGVLRYA